MFEQMQMEARRKSIEDFRKYKADLYPSKIVIKLVARRCEKYKMDP